MAPTRFTALLQFPGNYPMTLTMEPDWTSTIDGVPLRRAKEFVYLGGKMTEAADSRADVDRRIGLATGVAENLAVIWRSKDIGLLTKTRLYKALVLSVLLYNAESWTMTEEIGGSYLFSRWLS